MVAVLPATPDVTGVASTRSLSWRDELRSQPLTAAIPVVIVTGVEPPPDIPGATVLLKPCSMEALLDVFERALTPPPPASSL